MPNLKPIARSCSPHPFSPSLYYCSVSRYRERKKGETRIWAQTWDSEPPPHRRPRANRLWESLLFRKVCNSRYVMPNWPIALQQMRPQAYPTHHPFRACRVCYSQDNIPVTIEPLNPLPWVVCNMAGLEFRHSFVLPGEERGLPSPYFLNETPLAFNSTWSCEPDVCFNLQFVLASCF